MEVAGGGDIVIQTFLFENSSLNTRCWACVSGSEVLLPENYDLFLHNINDDYEQANEHIAFDGVPRFRLSRLSNFAGG